MKASFPLIFLVLLFCSRVQYWRKTNCGSESFNDFVVTILRFSKFNFHNHVLLDFKVQVHDFKENGIQGAYLAIASEIPRASCNNLEQQIAQILSKTYAFTVTNRANAIIYMQLLPLTRLFYEHQLFVLAFDLSRLSAKQQSFLFYLQVLSHLISRSIYSFKVSL